MLYKTTQCKISSQVFYLLIILLCSPKIYSSKRHVSSVELDSFHITTETPLKIVDDSGKILEKTFLPDPERFVFSFDYDKKGDGFPQCYFEIRYLSDESLTLCSQSAENQKFHKVQFGDSLFNLKKGLVDLYRILIQQTSEQQCEELSKYNSTGVQNLLKVKEKIVKMNNQNDDRFNIEIDECIVFYFFKFKFMHTSILKLRELNHFPKTTQAKQILELFEEQRQTPFKFDGNKNVIAESFKQIKDSFDIWMSKLSDFCSKNQFYESKRRVLK